MEKGLATGMTAYLVKPIDPDALYDAIAGLSKEWEKS